MTDAQCRAQCRALAHCAGIMINPKHIGTFIIGATCILLNSVVFPVGVTAPATCGGYNVLPILTC